MVGIFIFTLLFVIMPIGFYDLARRGELDTPPAEQETVDFADIPGYRLQWWVMVGPYTGLAVMLAVRLWRNRRDIREVALLKGRILLRMPLAAIVLPIYFRPWPAWLVLAGVWVMVLVQKRVPPEERRRTLQGGVFDQV